MAKPLHLFGYLLLFALMVLRIQVSNAYASSDGRVPIQKDMYGFYVEVDYRMTPTSAADTGKFILSLVHYKTFFSENSCLGFNDFDCYHHYCKIESGQAMDYFDDMYFGAAIKAAKIEAYLDHTEWELRANAYVPDIGTCKSQLSQYIGTGRTGILGMSPASGSEKNYLYNWNTDFLFSLSVNKDLSGGSLAFAKNQSIIDSLGSPITLSFRGSTPWQTLSTSVGVRFPTQGMFTYAKLMFDVHAEVMAFPKGYYNYIISCFSDHGVRCPDSQYKPECLFSGEISSLPTFRIVIQDQELSIPPSVYLKDPITPWQSKITLNLKSLDKNAEGNNYVTKNYEDTIILDAHFLSHYYALFNKNSVVLYGPPSSTYKSPWFIVLVLIVVPAVIVALGVFLKRRKSKPAENAASFIQQPFHAQQTHRENQY